MASRAVAVMMMMARLATGLEVSGWQLSRQQALRAFPAAVAASVVAPSSAGAYQGIYGMEIISASDAVLDEEALQTSQVKAALKDLKVLYESVKSLRAAIATDAQYDVSSVIRKEFEVTRVRNTFNALNPVFDKETQKGTDRLQRGIIQDLVEIDAGAQVAPGKTRSPKKLAIVNEKLLKLETTFQKLDEYFAKA